MIRRVFNKSASVRVWQIVNMLLSRTIGSRIGIIHLLEYPKCGGTWVRGMLETYFNVKPYHYDRVITPRTVIQIHKLPPWGKCLCNSVVLFRDPRDVFVSAYFHEKRLEKQGKYIEIKKYYDFASSENIKDDFEKYLRIKLTKATNPGFSYNEFINRWKVQKDVCLVTYEGFQNQPDLEMKKILTYLNISVDQKRLQYAIEYNTFENVTLRKYGIKRMQGEEDNEKSKRKGISGDWINYFNEKSCRLINRYMGDAILYIGYEESTNWLKEYNVE